jgi:hypothetical protein
MDPKYLYDYMVLFTRLLQSKVHIIHSYILVLQSN